MPDEIHREKPYKPSALATHSPSAA
jgi:hypothetical protein